MTDLRIFVSLTNKAFWGLRKFLSILLLVLLLFNILGSSVYNLMTDQVENFSTTESKSILLKMPLSLPYVTEWNGLEFTENELFHENSYYNILSQKITNDTLYVACQFQESARDRFWNLVSSYDDHLKPSDNHGKTQTGNIMKTLLKEYVSFDRKLTFIILEWLITQSHSDPATSLGSFTAKVSSPPPRLS